MTLSNTKINFDNNNNSNNNKTKSAGKKRDSLDGGSMNEFRKALASNLGISDDRLLAFRSKRAVAAREVSQPRSVLSAAKKYSPSKAVKVQRYIPSAPERILDAPELIDDYYLNLIDWGSHNILAVALNSTVYLWNASSGDIQELCSCKDEDDFVSSVKYIDGGEYLAVGTNLNAVQLWDVESKKMLRSLDGHDARVSSLAWNGHLLSSGGRDSLIVNHDVRVPRHKLSCYQGHLQEVCGLKWSPDGGTLASGGNDNMLCIWDHRRSYQNMTQSQRAALAPRIALSEHCAAVKALAWCPYQRSLLASGGGTADRTIKLWNTANGACTRSVDTGSQVCSLVWNPYERELLSSHGFSENQLCLWKFPSMTRVKQLNGHTARVLHMTVSPDGSTVCSAAADETLRFWKVFESSLGVKGFRPNDPSGTFRGLSIR